MLPQPDELKHNNPAYALIDESEIRGGFKSAVAMADVMALPSNKRKLNTVYSYNEIINEIACSRLLRYSGTDTDDENWQDSSNWKAILVSRDIIIIDDMSTLGITAGDSFQSFLEGLNNYLSGMENYIGSKASQDQVNSLSQQLAALSSNVVSSAEGQGMWAAINDKAAQGQVDSINGHIESIDGQLDSLSQQLSALGNNVVTSAEGQGMWAAINAKAAQDQVNALQNAVSELGADIEADDLVITDNALTWDLDDRQIIVGTLSAPAGFSLELINDAALATGQIVLIKDSASDIPITLIGSWKQSSGEGFEDVTEVTISGTLGAVFFIYLEIINGIIFIKIGS